MAIDIGETLIKEFWSGKSFILVVAWWIIGIIGIIYISFYLQSFKGCIFPIPTEFKNDITMKYIRTLRGKNYYCESDPRKIEKSDDTRNCLGTVWNILHIAFYAIFGFLVPKLFWQLFTMSIVFELIEYVYSQCQCPLDIAYNFIGLCIGVSLRYTFMGVH